MSVRPQKLVIYHKNCDDGFGACYAAWRALGDAAEYVAMDYKDPVDKLDVLGRDVYIVDFSFAPEVMSGPVLSKAAHITLLDHHLSAMDVWRGHLGAAAGDTLRHKTEHLDLFFDNGKSGAYLAWEFFHKGKDVPLFIRHISDGDLWRFALPGTQAFTAYLRAFPRDIPVWDGIFREMETQEGARKIIATGADINRFYEAQVQSIFDLGREVEIEMTGIADGKPVTARGLCVNASKIFCSELGHLLANKSGSFGIVWDTDGETAFCSMRSNKPFDCIPFATAKGGGGHAQACGFNVPLEKMIAAVFGGKTL